MTMVDASGAPYAIAWSIGQDALPLSRVAVMTSEWTMTR
jgi:hypothetical protein